MSERRGHMRAIGAELPRITRPALGRRGLGEGQLLTHWAAIVGPEIAEEAWPDRLNFPRGQRRDGTLRLRVSAAAALEVQHRAPIILERINGFLGYSAVARLTLMQAPAPRREPPPLHARPLRPEENAALTEQLAAIQDPELRSALARLGRAVIGNQVTGGDTIA